MDKYCRYRNQFAYVGVLLYLLCLFNISFTAFAKESNQPTITAYAISNGKCETKIKISGISARCTAYLQAYKTSKLAIKMELQKKKSGTYETIKTWSASKTGTTISLDEKRNINLLADYRLKTTFTAGSETRVAYAYPS